MKRIVLILSLIVLPLAALQARAPKYIFIMFGDGMSINSLTLTENYDAWEAGVNYCGKRINFREFPHIGLCETQSASASATGSSEAATALFCGKKSFPGAVGVDAGGNPVESVFSIFHDKGYRVGIMSTDPINHATPAVAYSHNVSRGNFREITRELPSSGFEFFAGDSFAEFDNVENGKNSDEYLAARDYPTYYGIEEFNARDRSLQKAILVHPKCRVKRTSITAETDRTKQYTLENDSTNVTPAQMLDCCLEMFSDKKPFIILCEEGDIDHAAHMNCPMGVIDAVHKLEDATGRALEFYRKHPKETLILVISDHETGGVSYGYYKKWIDWQTLKDSWKEGASIEKLNQQECLKLSAKCGVLGGTSRHTGAPTPIFAKGRGAEKFGRSLDNTDVARILLEL